jgi:hypothetical protein
MPSISTRILPSRKTFPSTRSFSVLSFPIDARWLPISGLSSTLDGECAAPKSNLILHALECKKSASLSIDTAQKAIGKWNRNPFFLLACLIRIRKNIYGCEMFAQFLCSQSFYLRSICIYEHMIGQNYWLYDKLSVFVAISYVSLWEGLVRVIRGT